MKVFLLSSRIVILGILLISSLSPAMAEEGSANSRYFAFAKPFVVNLSGGDNLSYLQVNVQFKLKKADLASKLQAQLPAIEHTMVMLLSDQTVSSIKSVQGKQALRETALKSVQEVCEKLLGDPAIDDVYFTGFIVQ